MASAPAILPKVLKTVQKLYPVALADKTWDNTGLLLEAPIPHRPAANGVSRVLLTIDLTTAVAEEALREGSGVAVIVAYHPIIFRGLKSLTMKDTQQRSLLRLAAAGISIYAPHTAVDAAVGGVNDWLADGVSGGKEHEEKREVLQNGTKVEGHEDGGMGRLVELKEPLELIELVKRVKKLTGLKYVQVARPQLLEKVKTIAICAGSGGSLFRGVQADCFFTGELGHHETLATVENGMSAIICGHTNTERGFLAAVMKPRLEELLKEEEEKIEVVVSEGDRDPVEIM
ncbi:NGG1p interacting factor 3 [Saitoella complicata NRRL Y-17804]|nr:NGG1p interacting factor 3 [Saitoella complicata NRRL Y-17804]ODQ55569.1 NGG1p interacting factor 3 [Saitoella complicata NRRL Y-17804]